MSSRTPVQMIVATAVLLVLASAASAFIERLYALKEILDESSHVVVGRITDVNPKARTATATVQRSLKGKIEVRTIRMNLGLGAEDHNNYVISHMRPDNPIILFYKRDAQTIACCAHTDGMWFQLFATDDPKDRDKIWWRFSHVEIYLPRTYSGSTPDLITLVDDVLAGKRTPPKPNASAPKIDVTGKAGQTATTAKPTTPAASPADGAQGGFRRQVEFKLPGGNEIRGMSWVDVNGDDLPDLYACRQSGNVLLLNQGNGKFKEMAATYGLNVGTRAAAWADYNGDGHPDLLTNDFRLYTNTGGAFRDDSALLSAPEKRNSEGAGWIDYNGDGLPDIIITNGEHGIRLFRNKGKGPQWFVDVSDAAGLGQKGLGAGNGDFLTCFDADADGYADFFYNLGDGILATNNHAGAFKAASKCGIALPGGDGYKRGLAVGDIDNDGDMDVFVPGPERARIYRNNNDGTFTDIYPDSGDPTKETDASFAAAFADVNADGNLDLFVAHTKGSSRLYLGDGKGHFTDIADAAGIRPLSPAYGAAFADVDGDGDLDLAVNIADRIVIAFNDMSPARGHANLLVRATARRGAVGAVIRVSDERDRLLGLCELRGAESGGGQPWPIAHFALPNGPVSVSVCLSDGRVAQAKVDMGGKPFTLTLADDQFN